MIQTCPCCKTEFRTCTACKQAKATDQFPFNKNLGKPEAKCFSCENARKRQYWASRAEAKPAQHRPRSEEHLPAIRACIDAGMTAQETAKSLSLSVAHVYWLARHNEMPPFSRGPAPVWQPDRLTKLLQGVAR